MHAVVKRFPGLPVAVALSHILIVFCFLTLTVLRSTTEVFCRMPLIWDFSNCSNDLGGKEEHRDKA